MCCKVVWRWITRSLCQYHRSIRKYVTFLIITLNDPPLCGATSTFDSVPTINISRHPTRVLEMHIHHGHPQPHLFIGCTFRPCPLRLTLNPAPLANAHKLHRLVSNHELSHFLLAVRCVYKDRSRSSEPDVFSSVYHLRLCQHPPKSIGIPSATIIFDFDFTQLPNAKTMSVM